MSGQQPLDAVGQFAPWAGDEERALRVRIHRALTGAIARATRERNGRSRALYYVAAEVGQAWVFRRVDDCADLERVIRALCQLFMAADNVFQLEGPDADE
ncbi:MAG TPA: hypothetical protein VMN38_11760 [Sphingomicrobium sp.]|nr:hypothetical protein [Sphingomicrobium sp.]